MKENETKVQIKIQSRIQDEGREEVNTSESIGRFFRKKHIDVLLYEEEMQDQRNVKNFITIQQDQVNIKRTGPISMNQRFIKGQMTEGLYQHPYGEFLMETNTYLIDYRPLKNKDAGRLILHYTVKMDDEFKRDHLLELVYQKEIYE